MSLKKKPSPSPSSPSSTKRIFLFDVDGTLTVPRKAASPETIALLRRIRAAGQIKIGIVGGSDLVKQKEQLGESVLDEFDYVFSENGLVAFRDGKQFASQSLKAHLGEEKIRSFVDFVLHYIADLDIPIKRGTFIEFRTGMINVSPIGRNCSQEERDEFERYDKIHQIRSKMVKVLQAKFANLNLTYSIGGQISFDVFPKGWDKTYCLQFLKEYDDIHFFGDKTQEGGNDYEIYVDPRVVGHSVRGPAETVEIVSQLVAKYSE